MIWTLICVYFCFFKQAFKNHKIVDPLENPGTADLTSNVDFLHLKSAIQTTGGK